MQISSEHAELAAQIQERFGTIHNFCKQHEFQLNRSTVYMVLRGVYAGNTARQVERIENALNECRPEEQIFTAIKQVACSRCSVTSMHCKRCDKLFTAQAKAVLEVV
ncbi:hypothetical protein [Halodesulfovibrio sp. MK-HDV]|jgi:hypothetical protein|uniref:hypothetical protein n=1 Tax=Halodesulfovibrio sp. MK-HDV TaxID=2599925 RepID=UPI0013719AFD|nr:hypothetical protein [Halodesulfovibrio sp. MK-HDV]